MNKFILSFVLVLTTSVCVAQTNANKTQHVCSGEVITRSNYVAPKTPHLLGNFFKSWGTNKGVRGATRFDRWSPVRKRTKRNLIVGKRRRN